MDDDKIERQIAFIIEQQARFDVNMARLQERIDRVDEQLSQLGAHVDRVAAQVNQVTGVVGNMSEGMVDLKDALLSLTNIVERHDNDIAFLIERDKETDARFRGIHENLRETDKRLNTIIKILEKR
jgi:chromosome segregation ATPase